MSVEKITILCKASQGALLPVYQSEGAAGADIYAYLCEPVQLAPQERRLIPTGLFFEIPEGYEIQIRPRSGLAIKSGITCLNSPGTIDSDYRGEIKVILINLSNELYTVQNGERIAQIIVSPVLRAEFSPASVLNDTIRGTFGFGSTGKK